MEARATDIQLQVMICTLGPDGISRVANASHPQVNGVEYLVSWQTDGDTPIPVKLDRPDFNIITTQTRGLSANRNFALSHASAPFLLISDDDADYTTEGLNTVINAFHSNPDADLIAFRYDSHSSSKFYPCTPCSLAEPPKGYFISSIELAFRRDAVQRKIWFNENFGIGAIFPSGEEDIFVRDCLDQGLAGKFLPHTIVSHEATTTSGRNLMLPSRPMTKGAIFMRLHPRQWPLRMLAHALREIRPWRKGLVPSPISYCYNWLKGVSMARRMKVFPTPDCGKKYHCHD